MMNAFDASVGVFVRGLGSMKVLIAKAEAHATARGIDPKTLLTAKLADSMNDFAVQAHWVCESGKLAVQRLLGSASPPLANEAKTFAELRERIDASIVELRSANPEALEAGLARTIELPSRGAPLSFRGDHFITEFAVPSFYFHLTTAYCILRHEGVLLEKGDFLGG